MITKKVLITGIVQGVGFRPFVYNLAQKFRLKGYVKNINSNVSILLQNKNVSKITDFIIELKRNHPQNAIISSIKIKNIKCKEIYQNFMICESRKDSSTDFYSAIPRDLALCSECQKELENPRDRRFRYAFINCINCGPRWSIIQNLPYDRERTAMSSFKMCKSCEREYRDVKNRRFHAQPNSCAKCGIKLALFDNSGAKLWDESDSRESLCESLCELRKCDLPRKKKRESLRDSPRESHDSFDIFAFLRKKIKNSKIICLKGIGGFNLICKVESSAITTLRVRKNRPRKPFAIMFRDIKCAKRYFHISKAEENALCSPSAPIVLLSHPKMKLPQNLNFNLNTYGVIIAYSALHKLLFKGYDKPLIFTSANLGGETIIADRATAQGKIAHIFDYLLDYNRAIINPIDDSLKRVLRGGKEAILRAGRGDYPRLMKCDFKSDEVVLALGAHQKSQIAIFFKGYVLISRYIGDLDNIDSINALKREVYFLLNLYNLVPSVILCDCHLGYESSKIAADLAREFGAKIARIYHHRAHFYSNLFDNNLACETSAILGVIFDGTGFGEDGTIWGGEVFLQDLRESRETSASRLPSADSLDFDTQQTPSLVSCQNLAKTTKLSRQNLGSRDNSCNSHRTLNNFFAYFFSKKVSGLQPKYKNKLPPPSGRGQGGGVESQSIKSLQDSRESKNSKDSRESKEIFRFTQNNQMQDSREFFESNAKSCHIERSEISKNLGESKNLKTTLHNFTSPPSSIPQGEGEHSVCVASPQNPCRIAHFSHFALLGGESAIKDISKIALGVLFSVYGREIPREILHFAHFQNIDLLYQMQQKGINSPKTSSVGRIFDFVAFMCGLDSQTFEGESGGYVESLYNPRIREIYDFEIKNGEILLDKIVRGIVGDLRESSANLRDFNADSRDHKADLRESCTNPNADSHESKRKSTFDSRTIIASKFINTLAQIILCIALETRTNRKNFKVIFSGGVFANKALCDKITREFRAHKIAHRFHSAIPTNDGGIAVGQIVAYLRGDFKRD